MILWMWLKAVSLKNSVPRCVIDIRWLYLLRNVCFISVGCGLEGFKVKALFGLIDMDLGVWLWWTGRRHQLWWWCNITGQ